jgi:peptidoglycan/xylan/chitin deacetylase (PgdA/CDA1 family)
MDAKAARNAGKVTCTVVLRCPFPLTIADLPLEEGECVLTFDDGPSLPGTDAILAALREAGVQAHFFVVGFRTERLPDLVREAARDGHVVGTHTYLHRNLSAASSEEQVYEVLGGFRAAAEVLAATGVAPFFRFPFLRESQSFQDRLTRNGIMVWDADASSDDWCGISVADVVGRTLAALRRRGRGVVLLHDIQPVTAVALPQLLETLRNEGFRTVRFVPETMLAGDDVASIFAPSPIRTGN